MPTKRNVVLTNGEIYHIFNRSIASQEIFIQGKIISRFLSVINYYRYPQKLSYSKFKKLSSEDRNIYLKDIRDNSKPIVELYAYALMPDHYHLLLKQLTNKGISQFIANIQNSFAKYFNLKTKRDGGIFKTPFKSKWISSDEIFLHVSRYIHLNPVTSYLIEFNDLENYPWTSFKEYVKETSKDEGFINKDFLLNILGGKNNFVMFVSNQTDYQRELKRLKTIFFE